MNDEQWHLKPNSGGPCAVCGCPARRLKAKHRRAADGSWEKRVKVCFGTDWSIETAAPAPSPTPRKEGE
jgi:hypothetical protein